LKSTINLTIFLNGQVNFSKGYEKKGQPELIKKIKKLNITLGKIKLNIRLYLLILNSPTNQKQKVNKSTTTLEMTFVSVSFLNYNAVRIIMVL